MLDPERRHTPRKPRAPLTEADDIGEPVESATNYGPIDQGAMARLNLGELEFAERAH